MSATESDALEELRRRAAENPAPPLEGEHIPAGEAPPLSDTERAMLEKLRRMMVGTVRISFARWAPYWISEKAPEDVRVKQLDLELLADSYAEVLNEYLPWLLEKFPALAGAALSTALVLGGPLAAGLPRFEPKPEKPAEPDATAAPRA